MTASAARKKAALFALAAASLAGAAEASLRNDAGRTELLAARPLATALAPAEPLAIAVATPSPFHLFPQPASAPTPPPSNSQKVASGLARWAPKLNLKRIHEFVGLSRWSHENLGDVDSPNRYWFVAGRPAMALDPTGELLRVAGDPALRGLVAVDLDRLAPGTRVLMDGTVVAPGALSWPWAWKPKGSQLITRLVSNPRLAVIVAGRGRPSRTTPAIPRRLWRHAIYNPVNAVVSYDPLDTGVWIQIQSGPYAQWPTPSVIILGHELIHALHFLEGTINNSWLYYAPLLTRLREEELCTVGMWYKGVYYGGDITENDLRAELTAEPDFWKGRPSPRIELPPTAPRPRY